MDKANQGVISRLNRLYRLCRAGEKGFEVVAENVSNRGLKVLLKTYAQQRANFAEELKKEVERLGGAVAERDSIRAIIHRGRIDIRATLTIGPQNVENVVLSEAALGEQAAVNAYKMILTKELPQETQRLIARQAKEVQEVSDTIDHLRGHSGSRLVVRLFDSEGDTDAAVQALQRAGFPADAIDVIDVGRATVLYGRKGNTVKDAVVSGAVGGSIWGGILGAIFGLTILLIPNIEPIFSETRESTWALVALGGTAIGALFGAILGFLIGQGISEEDTYIYDDSVKHGVRLIRLTTDNARAAEAAKIMHQINAAARVRGRNKEVIGEPVL